MIDLEPKALVTFRDESILFVKKDAIDVEANYRKTAQGWS